MQKILIVDDERDVCDVLKESLEFEGYQAAAAYSGEEALERLSSEKFDLILVDLRLEGRSSGVDVIRQVGAFASRPHILATSGTPKKLIAAILEEEGIQRFVDNVLEKPSDLTPDKVLEAVRQALRG